MPLNTQIANASVNAQGDAIARHLDNGYLRIYSGAQPATADTALSANTLLAELGFAATLLSNAPAHPPRPRPPRSPPAPRPSLVGLRPRDGRPGHSGQSGC